MRDLQGRPGQARALWVLIGVSTAIRLVWACLLGAAVDEPYYFQFIRHLDWSYFDHPPMVALVGLPGLILAGDPYSVPGLRLGFIILFACSTWLIARLATRYFGAKAGFYAALALNVSGYFGLGVGTIAQPDGPLLFFWLLTLDRLSIAFQSERGINPWVWVGLAWGGAMQSKYHAVLLPVGALLFLALRPESRRCLKTPGPYLAAVLGLTIFAPVVVWNSAHGWASFLFQGGRAEAPKAFRLDHLAVAIGSETLYLFPWLWLAMAGLLVLLLWRGVKSWDVGESFMVSQAVPALLLFHWVASFGRIMPYWPLFGFIALMPLLGRTWARGLDASWPFLKPYLVAITLFPVLLIVVVTLQDRTGLFEDRQGRIFGLIAPGVDPTNEPIAWDQVAAELRRRGLIGKPNTFFFTDSWNRSASLALALRDQAPVACYQLEPRSFNLWSRPEDWVGRDGIFIEDDRRPGQLSHFNQWFLQYEPIGTVKVERRGHLVREVYLYHGHTQSWPFPFDGRLKARATTSPSAFARRPGQVAR